MISETGQNLSVLIVTEMGKDWETFATWYSLFKNLPDAQVAIACQRFGTPPFQLYQWARRLKLNLFFHDRFTEDDHTANWLNSLVKASQRQMIGENVLVISPLIMAIDTLSPKLANREESWIDEHVWFLKNPNASDMLDQHFLTRKTLERNKEPLCVEAKETENLSWLVSYKKGCGKWINTLRGCPFSSAAGHITIDMTVNESRIIELWKRMCSLYSTLK